MEMKKYKLSEICRIASSKRIFESEYVERGVPFIRGQEISDGSILDPKPSFECYISQSRYEEIKEKYGKPNKGDILITAVGTIGNLCYLDKDIDFYFKDGNVIWFSEIISSCDGKFLFHFMKSSYFKEQLKYFMIGAVQKALTIDMLKKVEVPLPPLPTQQKIAAVLSSLDDKIALNKKINTKLEAMAKRLYDYWFVQFDYPDKNGKPFKTSGCKMVWNEVLKREIPEGWEVVEMSSVIKQINTGLNPRDNFILGNGKIKYITVKNLTEEGHIDFSNCDLVNSESQKIIHERSQIQKGDILFASICPLGRCYLIQDSPEDWDINESVFSIRPNIDRITSEFLYTLLREAYYVKKMTQKATGSIFKGIRINDIEKIEIVLPPKEVINAFSKKTLPIFNYQLTIQKEIQKLTNLRDRLLPLLINGKADVLPS